jgi:UDP-N-acetylmuramoyl-tripeptide--D-alanyl-D-alanine ligase
MAELGTESLEEHKAIVEQISQHTWKAVVLVGGDFLQIQHPYLSFPDAATTKDWFDKQQFENSTILVKGSRSMQMEKILA